MSASWSEIREESLAGMTWPERVWFHLIRWAVLLVVALVTYVAFPTPGSPEVPVGLLRNLVGPVLFSGLILGTFWLLLMFYRWETYSSLREMVFFGIVFSLVVTLSAIVTDILPGRPELIPVPFAAILVTLIYNGRLGLYAATAMAILVGSQESLRSTDVLFITLIAGVAAAVGTRAARRRKELYFTIGATIGAYTLAAVTLGLLQGWELTAVGWSVTRGAVTALGSASVSMLLLPAAEAATKVTTDITLLELSDPSRPLLRRLAQEAPGTWAHSLAMANLCEAACNAIAANGLLARVGCYYHDIGKALHPEYFAENQRPGHNPHDQVRPAESAAIVRNHVLDGIAMAREAGLPESIIVFIPEHHGTLHIEYFLDRARKDGDSTVNPEDFRYPGPKPRSAETAIVMLADSTEAALRLLGDPTIERVRSAVDFLIQEKLDLGQLKDAPLTLSQLDRVKEEFVRVMSSMRHVRVEYPGRIGGIAARFPQVKKT